MKSWQRYAAELLGTFVLVFVGTLAIAGTGRVDVPVLLVVPFAFGLALLAGLYAFGEVSGGHYNPAVSIGMLLDRRLSVPDFVGYVVAQIVGAILAALVLLAVTSTHEVAGTVTKPGASDGAAFIVELVMTTIFVLVVLQSTRSGRFGTSALIAIPLTLLVIHFAAIPFSGSSVNPARTIGPDLVGGVWTGIWIYLIAPPLGGILAWAIHAGLVRGGVPAPEAPVAEVLGEPDASTAAAR